MDSVSTAIPGDALIVAPSGRLDASSAARLGQEISSLLNQDEARVIVNLADVHYLSSSILRVLLKAHRRANQTGGALALCCLQPQVLRVFEWVGFDQVLTICADEDDARRALLSTMPPRAPGGSRP